MKNLGTYQKIKNLPHTKLNHFKKINLMLKDFIRNT